MIYTLGSTCIIIIVNNIVIQCPDLSDSTENGEVVITPTARTVNSTAEYSCIGGYKLDKGDVKRICQTEGIWSGQAPQCSECITACIVQCISTIILCLMSE